jgi:hypothetical protein
VAEAVLQLLMETDVEGLIGAARTDVTQASAFASCFGAAKSG